MTEIDVCLDPAMDLLNDTIAQRRLQVLASNSDVVLATPPSTPFLEIVSFNLALALISS